MRLRTHPGIDDPLPAARELACLGLILAVALVARMLGYDAPDTPRWYFAESTVVWVQRALEEGDLWHLWLLLLRNTHVSWVHESAVMMPVAIGFQRLLGPSLHLPMIIGAFWGVLAVLLAWLAGRSVRSPAFGLLFAAFVAASPLQITWARLGGLQIGASAHVMLVIWLACQAGRRQSALLAVLAVAATCASVYHYYAARVALPFGALALLLGPPAGGRRRMRTLRVVLAVVLAVGAITWWVRPAHLGEAVWPRYTGYVGWQGERSVREYATSIRMNASRELPGAVQAYFVAGRAQAGPPATTTRWRLHLDPVRGGLCLVPVGVLGLLGLVVALRHPWRELPWLALTAVGFLIPLMSVTTARRFLPFDLAWCALAATSVLAVLGSRLLARFAAGTVPLAVGLVLLLGAYATWVVLVLSKAMPPICWAIIPFGESGFGDGFACKGCALRARAWQDEIRDGAFIVLFDSNLDCEVNTIPGGLPLYGKIAALAAGRPRNFVEYYGVAANFDVEPPHTGPVYDAARTDAFGYLARRIDEAAAARIVWHFPEATQWERELARRLVAAGSEPREVEEPPLIAGRAELTPPLAVAMPAVGRSILVTTPWAERARALEVITELSRPSPEPAGCAGIEKVAESAIPRLPLVLGAREDASAAPPRWVVGSWHEVIDGGSETPASDPVAISRSDTDAHRLHVLTRYAGDVSLDLATGTRTERSLSAPTPIGRDCGVRIGEKWWLVDPITGTLSTAPSGTSSRQGSFTGIARDAAGRLLLASADQLMHVIDPRTGSETARFPARVPPSRRYHFAECTPVVAGDGWIATLDHFRSTLAVYRPDGAPLGVLHLDEPLRLGGDAVTSVQATGPYLGLGTRGQRLVTLKLDVASGCAPPDLSTLLVPRRTLDVGGG